MGLLGKGIAAGLVVLGVWGLTVTHMAEREQAKTNHVQKGVVLEVGACHGGVGFFGGNRECPIRVQVGKQVYFWVIYNSAMVGQVVYRECWNEGSTAMCRGVATHNPRKEFLAGGKK